MPERDTSRRVFPEEVERIVVPVGPLSVLGLLSDSRIQPILRILAEGSQQPHVIERRIGTLAHATLMNRLTVLHEGGVITRRSLGGMPKVAMVGLTDAGRELLPVFDAATAWAARGPRSASETSMEQKVRALDGGWESTLIQVLGAVALRRSVLSTYVPVSYHQSLRRMDALVLAGLVEEVDRGPKRFAVSSFGRHGMAVVLRATDWQHRYALTDPGAAAADHLAAAIAVALPLVEPGSSWTGAVDLLVQSDAHPSTHPCVRARLSETGTRVEPARDVKSGPAAAQVLGTVDGWAAALLRGDVRGLKTRGDAKPAALVVAGLHKQLAAAS